MTLSKAETFQEKIKDETLAHKAISIITRHFETNIITQYNQDYPDANYIVNQMAQLKELGILSNEIVDRYADKPEIRLELHKQRIRLFFEYVSQKGNSYYVEEYHLEDSVYHVEFCLAGTENSEMVHWLDGQIHEDWLRFFYENEMNEVPFEELGYGDQLVLLAQYLNSGRMVAIC